MRRFGRRRLQFALSACAVVVAVLFAAGVVAAVISAQSALAAANAAQASIDLVQLPPEQLVPRLQQPVAELDALRQVSSAAHRVAWLRRPTAAVAWAVGWLPWVGPRVRALADTVALAGPLGDSADAGTELLALYARTFNDDVGLLSADGRARLPAFFAGMSAPSGRLRDAVGELDRRRAAIDDEEIAVLPPRLRDALVRTRPALSRAARVTAYLADMPAAANQWLGLDRPRTFAILGVERRELRAGGGFVGALTVVRVSNGQSSMLGTYYSYDVDPTPVGLPLPQPLSRYMGAGEFHLFDMSWFADFPTAAAASRTAIERSLGVKVDAVIAMDFEALASIVELVGPEVQVATFPEPVTRGNLQAQLDRLVKESLPDLTGARKGPESVTVPLYVGDLVKGVLNAGEQLSADRLAASSAVIEDLISARHMSVWYPEAPSDRLIAETAPALTGALRIPDRGDYLYVTHSDVGWSWNADCVDRPTLYEVWARADGAIERAALTVQFTSHVSEERDTWHCIGGHEWDADAHEARAAVGTFSDYVRTYVPVGTTLIRMTGVDAAPEYSFESGAAVMAGLVRVPEDAVRTLRVQFAPPGARAVPGGYDLFVPKQPGTDATPLRVVLHLPDGVAVVDRGSGRVAGYGPRVEFNSDLTTDFRLALEFRPPPAP